MSFFRETLSAVVVIARRVFGCGCTRSPKIADVDAVSVSQSPIHSVSLPVDDSPIGVEVGTKNLMAIFNPVPFPNLETIDRDGVMKIDAFSVTSSSFVGQDDSEGQDNSSTLMSDELPYPMFFSKFLYEKSFSSCDLLPQETFRLPSPISPIASISSVGPVSHSHDSSWSEEGTELH